MAITTDRDILRLEIGDTDPARPRFADDELQVFLDRHPGNVLAAAINCCHVLATRFAGDFDFKWKDQSFSRSQMSKAYAARAKELQERADRASGVGTIVVTREDSYGDVERSGRVGAGYSDPDLPD